MLRWRTSFTSSEPSEFIDPAGIAFSGSGNVLFHLCASPLGVSQPAAARSLLPAGRTETTGVPAFGQMAWQAVRLPSSRCSVCSGSPLRSAAGAIGCHPLVFALMKPVTSHRTARFPLWWNILSWNMKSATDTQVRGHYLSASPFLFSQHKAAIWERRCAVASGLRLGRSKYVMCSVLRRLTL